MSYAASASHRRHSALSYSDLARLENESRRYFYLGILAGIALQALLILLVPGVGMTPVERHMAVAIPVDLIALPPDMANPFADWRPAVPSSQPLERRTSSSTPPAVTTTRPERFGDSPSIIGAAEAASALTAAEGTVHDSLGTITGLALVPEIALPIRNRLFVDTGEHKTGIVFDPDNPQAIQGFAHFGVLWSQNLRSSTSRILSINHLAGEVTGLTNIDLVYDNQVMLMESVPSNVPRRYNPERPEYNMALGDYNVRDRMARDYAFTIIPVASVFALTQEEYYAVLTGNRFILVDNAGARYDDGQIDECIRKFGYADGEVTGYIDLKNMGVELLLQTEFEALPRYHPVYHSFYDFDGPPPSTEAPGHDGMDTIYAIYTIINGRPESRKMIGMYTPQGYTRSWEDPENIEQIKMGVNLVAYALAQYGIEYQPETGDYRLTSETRVLER